MGREFELKFRAVPQQLEAIRQHYGDFSSISMETTYYDTPAQALRRLHWTLRRRLENGRSVCTLKTPLPDGSRGEWELEADTIEAATRTLANPNPEKMEALIRKLVREKMADGQLNDSALTFCDLDKICATFCTVLTGVFHERIEYPEIAIPPREPVIEKVEDVEEIFGPRPWTSRTEELLAADEKKQETEDAPENNDKNIESEEV